MAWCLTSAIIALSVLLEFTAIARETTYTRTQSDIKTLEAALETFKIEYGRYPSEQEGLTALVIPPVSIHTTNWEPYLREPLTKDVWSHAFVYRVPGKHNPSSFDLYSCGEDGVSETGGSDADDINNWDRTQKWMHHYRPWVKIKTLTFMVVTGLAIAVAVFWITAKILGHMSKRVTVSGRSDLPHL